MTTDPQAEKSDLVSREEVLAALKKEMPRWITELSGVTVWPADRVIEVVAALPAIPLDALDEDDGPGAPSWQMLDEANDRWMAALAEIEKLRGALPAIPLDQVLTKERVERAVSSANIQPWDWRGNEHDLQLWNAGAKAAFDAVRALPVLETKKETS